MRPELLRRLAETMTDLFPRAGLPDSLQIGRENLAMMDDGRWERMTEDERTARFARSLGVDPEWFSRWSKREVDCVVDEEGNTLLEFDGPASPDEAWEALIATNAEAAEIAEELGL